MQILVNGIITGLTIAVLALAFIVVYLPTQVFHVALGGIYVLVPFVTWAGIQAKIPWSLSVLLAILTTLAVSLLCERFNHRPLERKGAGSGVHLVSSLGIYIILVQIVALIWGNETKVLRTGLDGVVKFGAIVLTNAQLGAAMISVVTLAIFYLWLHYSQLGLQFRALADNPKEFALRGYNVHRLRLLAFGISGLLGAVSSLLVAYDIGFDPNGGLSAVLLAVVAAIIGGRQSFLGPILGGILLGVIRSEVVWFLSARWQEAVTFLILALFLFLRPNGILGAKVRLEAEQ
jgi:branched-chain amino acid transport system permease protein